MKRLRDSIDAKYFKVCVYAGATVLVTAVAMMLLYLSGGLWAKIWGVFIAVLKPLIIGIVFWYLLSPLVSWFEKLFTKNGPKKWAKGVAVLLTYLLILVALIVLILVIVLTMYKSFSAISIDGIKALFSSMADEIQDFGKMIQDKLMETGLPINKITSIFGALVSGIAGFFTQLLFGIIFSVYFLLDGKMIANYFRRLLLALIGEKNDESMARFFGDVDQVFSGYVRGEFLDALIVGVITTLILQLAGVPSAVVVGLLTGLGNLIPYFGPVIGYITVIIVCVPVGAWTKLVIGIVLIAVIMFVDGNIINPKLLSNAVEVHALLVVAALIAGGVIGGLVGMVVAVPVAALLKLQVDRFLEKKEKQRES